MFSFLHSYYPSPVLFSFGPLNIYWYGLFAAVGILAGWAVVSYLAGKYNLTTDLFNLYIGVVIAALVGARFYHVINELGYYSQNPLAIFTIWEGGLALHGGIIGGILYGFWWTRKKGLLFMLLLDIFAPAGILFQAIGRWGNYFNEELFGRPTDLAWGIPITVINRPEGFMEFHYFHPTFLYESLLALIIFILLIGLHKLRLNGKIKLTNGYIFLWYLLLYSAVRFALEFLRIDATPVLFNWRLPQVVSLLIILAVILFFIKRLFKKESINNNI